MDVDGDGEGEREVELEAKMQQQGQQQQQQQQAQAQAQVQQQNTKRPTKATRTGPKPLAEWTMAEVARFARDLGFTDAVCTAIEANLVNGEMLRSQLTDDDLKDELGLTPLQIKRLRLELVKLV